MGGTICCCTQNEASVIGQVELPEENGAEELPKDVSNWAGRDGGKPSPQDSSTASQELPDPALDASPQSPTSASELHAKLATVEQLIDQLLIHDAGLVLQELDQAAQRAAAASPSDQEIKTFLDHLRSDPMLSNLRSFLSRYKSAVAAIAVPAQRTDVEWSSMELKEPAISDDFVVHWSGRLKTSEEYDPKGPLAQFVIRAEICNFPLRMSRRLCLEREVDLVHSLAPPGLNIELVEGECGKRTQLFSSCLRVIGKNKLNPFKMDNVEVREFSLLKDPPVPGLRSNMLLMMATGPPEGATEFCGFRFKPCASGCKRLSGLRILRFLEPESKPERCRITILAEGGINVPTFLIPLSLIKRVLAHAMMSSIKNAAEKSAGPLWDTLEFQKRIEQCSEFYEPVAQHDSIS